MPSFPIVDTQLHIWDADTSAAASWHFVVVAKSYQEEAPARESKWRRMRCSTQQVMRTSRHRLDKIDAGALLSVAFDFPANGRALKWPKPRFFRR
jgi:hypothetical protein